MAIKSSHLIRFFPSSLLLLLWEIQSTNNKLNEMRKGGFKDTFMARALISAEVL